MVAGARIWAGLAVLFWAVAFFGIVDLLTVFSANEGFAAVMGLEASWGVLFTFVISGAFLAIAARPQEPAPALVQLWTTAAALLLAWIFTYDTSPLVVAAILIPMTVLSSVAGRHDRRSTSGSSPGTTGRQPRRRRATSALDPSGPLLLLGLVGVPFWWAYAATAVELSQTPGIEDDITWGLTHWPVQAALGLYLSLAVLVMTFWAPGRTLLGTSCWISSVVLGATWLLYPASAGSVDSAGLSVLAVGWGTAVFFCRYLGHPRPDPPDDGVLAVHRPLGPQLSGTRARHIDRAAHDNPVLPGFTQIDQ
ncbi:hypothetical protein [Arthrobacter sp. VKM Ac-2550]|uniref:hypothetical protein n=1 Tax=Crystallibacter permensis TaxID=1938888 RepID=UPI002227E65B|nr:hypothetical protein [Arthrobacter sp. VKM Ac-2550]MCW2134636.1 hypothetical protein [Arthrobacter sp. VKM Ac-2550]